MIPPNELRKGNWFNTFLNDKFKAEELRRDFVMGISDSGFCNTAYSEIEPIPLTPSILEKAGFLKEDWSYIFPFNGGNTAYSIEQYGSKFGFCYSGQVTKETWVEYLHQLQNLYFCLTGEELEIKSLE